MGGRAGSLSIQTQRSGSTLVESAYSERARTTHHISHPPACTAKCTQPGNDASPVYKLELESSRLYGITDRRAFVFDWVSVARFHSDNVNLTITNAGSASH